MSPGCQQEQTQQHDLTMNMSTCYLGRLTLFLLLDIEQWIGYLLASSESQKAKVPAGASKEEIEFLCNE
jgi:hypothetical protein